MRSEGLCQARSGAVRPVDVVTCMIQYDLGTLGEGTGGGDEVLQGAKWPQSCPWRRYMRTRAPRTIHA